MREAVVSSAKRAPETDAGYACARLRGMRANLLDAGFYERLIAAPDVQSMVKELMETPYRSQLETEIVKGMTSAVVDDALKENMVHSYRKVLGFLDQRMRAALITLLARWDVFNVKTILRGAHNHVGLDEIKESLMPAGALTSTELEALAKLDDVKAIVDTMAMWGLDYAAALRRAYPEYAKDGNLASLELALDRRYAEWAASRLIGESSDVDATRRILGIQIDILNLVTVFRMMKDEVGAEKASRYFLEGGRVVRFDLFLELSKMSDVDEVLDRLKRTPYGEVLDDAAVRYLEMQSIAVFERVLEELLMRKAVSAGVRDPHGVGVAIAYLWAKQNEVTNVRIIVRGKSVGMPADRVREELILV